MLALLSLAAFAQELSGLAPAAGSCVAVSDVKDEAKPRVFLLDAGVPSPIRLSPGLPVDLEAITPVGDRYVVASGSGGTFASFSLGGGAVRDVRQIKVKGAPADQVEGILALDAGALLVGTRGTDGAPSTLSVYKIDAEKGKMKRVSEPVELVQPCNLGDKARSVAELALDPAGKVWAVGATDPGDEGPFTSCAYALDLTWDGHTLTAKPAGPVAQFGGDKVEGLAWCGGNPTAATDNEALPQRVFSW